MNERRYPHHPIPGVGVVVYGDRGVLLVRRHKEPGKGLWSIPGGAIEVGETQEQTAQREVFEETGVNCRIIRFLSTADVIIKDTQNEVEYHFLLNHYFAQASTDNLSPEFPEAEVAWFQPSELPEDEMPSKILDLILSALRDIE